jgi:hypothetical protein
MIARLPSRGSGRRYNDDAIAIIFDQKHVECRRVLVYEVVGRDETGSVGSASDVNGIKESGINGEEH